MCFRQHGTTPDYMEDLLSCDRRNGTKLSLTSYNSHVGKGPSMRSVVGDLVSKLWTSDVVAVGHNSSRDTQGTGWRSPVDEDEVSVEWE